jgi:hypothetical protein
MTEDRFIFLKNIKIANSPDEISQEDFIEYGDFWYIGSWLIGDTYFYIGVPLANLKQLYYA